MHIYNTWMTGFTHLELNCGTIFPGELALCTEHGDGLLGLKSYYCYYYIPGIRICWKQYCIDPTILYTYLHDQILVYTHLNLVKIPNIMHPQFSLCVHNIFIQPTFISFYFHLDHLPELPDIFFRMFTHFFNFLEPKM